MQLFLFKFVKTHKLKKTIMKIEEEIKYWKSRCAAAEELINKSLCDSDITKRQIDVRDKWEKIKNQEKTMKIQKNIPPPPPSRFLREGDEPPKPKKH
jgi:hypothetical protein